MATDMTTSPSSNHTGPRKSDRWIPWYFVGGFAVMLIANISLITFSMTSWNGLVTKHAFEEGNNYNAAISGAARQEELGWRSKLSVDGVIDHNATITVLFRDKDLNPITGAKMSIVMSRADRDDLDTTIPMAKSLRVNIAPVRPSRFMDAGNCGPLPMRWAMIIRRSSMSS